MEGLETKLEAGVEDTAVAAGDTTVVVEETKLEAGVNAQEECARAHNNRK